MVVWVALVRPRKFTTRDSPEFAFGSVSPGVGARVATGRTLLFRVMFVFGAVVVYAEGAKGEGGLLGRPDPLGSGSFTPYTAKERQGARKVC